MSSKEKFQKSVSREQKELLEKIQLKTTQFVKQLDKTFPSDERVQLLKSRYKKTFFEVAQTPETYTLEKGKKIVMCLNNYHKDKQLHDDFNLLMFVSLHELAHVMSQSKHHTTEFWNNFTFILQQAHKMGYYYPEDYRFNPVQYCNMIVDDNPFFVDVIPNRIMRDVKKAVQ